MDYNKMWDLNTGEKLDGLTWWWWWWIFFIKDRKNPKQSKQLMILWSTKNCDHVKVRDFDWHRKKDMVQKPGKLTFDGMTAVWYYNGRKMIEPLALVPSDFTVKWKGESGELIPHTSDTFTYKGNPDKYRVRITHDGYDFDFVMTPWNDFMSEHRYNANHYMGKFGYNILKIYGSQLRGSITEPGEQKEKISGTAYFQKVMVNAPSVPWYWGVIHAQDGSYIDYFMPHIGPPLLRRTVKPRSIWDWGELHLNRGLQYYIKERDDRLLFKKFSVYKKFTGDNLPVFHVSARSADARIDFILRSYSRAYWRFEQPWWGRFNSILYYNEYPVAMEAFRFRDQKSKITLEDLGYVTGNAEHSWGMLMW